jgi:putative endonuclease
MQREIEPAVYIMASRYRGTIYTGVTSALWDRVCNHKNDVFKGFTSKYKVKTLVWYEHHATMDAAIKRESQIKAWKRQWKIEMIEKLNSDWTDLHELIEHRPYGEN